MSFSDLSGVFVSGGLLTWQQMDQLADNDAYIQPFVTPAPTFGAYLTNTQAIVSATPSKVQFNIKEWDTYAYFDAVTNYRFLPLVAGKYMFTGRVSIAGLADQKYLQIMLYKNGVIHHIGDTLHSHAASETLGSVLSCFATANGSTDYFELYVQHDHGSNLNLETGQAVTFFSGAYMAG